MVSINKTLYFFYVFLILQSCSDCEQKLSYSIDNLEIYGVVKAKYIDSTNHLYPTIIFEYKSEEIYFIAYERFSGKEFFNYINQGDSIIKMKSSREFTVIKNDSSQVFKFKCKEF